MYKSVLVSLCLFLSENICEIHCWQGLHSLLLLMMINYYFVVFIAPMSDLSHDSDSTTER